MSVPRFWKLTAALITALGLVGGTLFAAGLFTSEDEPQEPLSEKSVGVEAGTTGEVYAKEEAGAGSVRLFPRAADAVDALESGELDVAIVEEIDAVEAIERRNSDLEITERIETEEVYGIFLPQGSDVLREEMNAELAAMKADGTLAELYQRYFASEPPPAVLDGSTEVLDDDEDVDEDVMLERDASLRVATAAPFPPFERGEPPQLTGFDIELMDEVASRIGLAVTYEDAPFETIFRDVARGRFEAGIAAALITPGRSNLVDFTDPYYEARQVLLAPPE